MAHVFDAGKDLRIIFDLMWVQATDNSNASVREAAGDANLVVLAKNASGDVMVGIYKPTADQAKTRRKQVSFAALMARKFESERSALIFIDLGNGKAAMAAISNGLPVPDTDRFGEMENLIQVALEFIADNPGVKIYGNSDLLLDFEVEPFDFLGYLQEKDSRKIVKSCMISKIGSNKRVVIMGLALLLIVGNMAYEHYEKKRKEEEAARLAAQQKTPEQIYAEGLPMAIQQQGIPVPAARKLVATARGQEMRAAGWKVTRIMCSSSGCSATWARSNDSATFADLIAVLGKQGLQLATDQTAVKSIPVDIALATSPDRYPNPAKLKGELEAWTQLLSPLQRLGKAINFGVNNAAPLQVNGVTIPNGIRKGELKVRGPAWIDQYLIGLPEWTLVRDISYSIAEGGEPSTEATVIYLTKAE